MNTSTLLFNTNHKKEHHCGWLPSRLKTWASWWTHKSFRTHCVCDIICLCPTCHHIVHAERQTILTMHHTVMRHNNVRDTEAALLQEVCKDVTIEPPLIPSNELGYRSSLDVGARGLWSGLEKTLFDVRIFHPGAKSYQNRSLEAIYKAHEKEKKDKYLTHVLTKEKCTFTPLVFSTHGGSGPEAEVDQRQNVKGSTRDL